MGAQISPRGFIRTVAKRFKATGLHPVTVGSTPTSPTTGDFMDFWYICLLILLYMVIVVVPLTMLWNLINIRRSLVELIQISKGTNSRLDTHTKALSLVNKALGSVFHAVKRSK